MSSPSSALLFSDALRSLLRPDALRSLKMKDSGSKDVSDILQMLCGH